MIEFRVFRFDPGIPPDDSAINGSAPEYLKIAQAGGNAGYTPPARPARTRFDAFPVPEEKGMTVLDGLYYILENIDGSLAFRSSCRAAVCGSCAMHINGKYRLACNTLVSKLASPVVIRPLAHLPVIKDLVVDMTNFFRHYEAIEPYLMRNAATPDKEVAQSPEEHKKIEGAIDCILCGACYGSCPVAGTNPDYIGPHSILKTLRFINDSRDTEKAERLQMVASSKGLWRCHSIFNCQAVCPKDLDPAGAIGQLKRRALWHKIKQIFGTA